MKYSKIFMLVLLSAAVLFAAEDPMGSMTIEYGPHDILSTSKATTEQRYVSIDFYEQVVEPVESGHNAARRGDYEAAATFFREALREDSTYVFAYNGLGNAYLKMGDLQRAEQAFRQAIKFGNTYAFPYNNLANLYLIQNRQDEALPLLLTAIKLDPNSAYVYYNMGNVYLNNGDNSTAHSYYLKALKLDKNLCNARYNLALAYNRMNLYGQAIEEYEKTVRTCPGHEKAVLNLAAHYLQSRQPDKALMLYRQALVVNPKPSIYVALGHALYNRNNYKDAIQAYREAVKLDSTHLEAKYYLALSYYEQDMTFSTRELVKDILQQDPSHSGALLLKEELGI
jgi:tetratricopeptide (TPR) repeat protein